MRREQIFKICLNFFLTDEIELKRKEDNSWTFAAVDFSEGEFEPTSFAVRLKNKEIADGFKKAIDDALAGVGSENVEKQDGEADEKSELLKRLMLPENFFDYLNATDCTGCIGCNSESYDYNATRKSDVINETNLLPREAPKLNCKQKPRRQSVDKHVSFKLANEKEASENEKLKQLFGTGNVQEKTNVFGGGIKKSEGSTNIFADFTAENPATSFFGITGLPKPVFGAQNDSAAPVNSIFSSSLNTTPAAATSADSATPFSKAAEPFSGGIFGNKTAFSFNNGTTDDGSIFGSTNGDSTVKPFQAFSTTPKFGSNIFGSSVSSNQAPDSTTSAPVSTNIFGSASSFSFANAARELNMAKDPNQPAPIVVPDFIQKSSNAGGFAALAANSTPEKGWTANNSTTPAGGFFGLTVKDDFFSKNLNKNQDADTSNNEEGGTNDENYDPHYDPIISLPDEINVSTGEEEEEKCFGERAKLFRYDANTKEWKERGEFKVQITQKLFH